jgi:hypothetical protein
MSKEHSEEHKDLKIQFFIHLDLEHNFLCLALTWSSLGSTSQNAADFETAVGTYCCWKVQYYCSSEFGFDRVAMCS